MKKLTEKDAILCKTQKQWDSIIEMFSLEENVQQYDFNTRRVILVKKDIWDTLVRAKENGYNIIKAKDILKKSKIKELEKRVFKLEKFASDNTTIGFHQPEIILTEPLKFDLPKKELEELPEKWCILCTEENAKILNKYLHENKEKYRLYNQFWVVGTGGYFVSENQNGGHTIAYEYPKEYTEINFDQFKKWVLKEEEKPLSIREVQVKFSNQEEANECAEIAKASGEKVEFNELEIVNKYCYFRKASSEEYYFVVCSKDV